MTADERLVLYSYWRSSAAYRVRLALAWKGLTAEIVPVDLRQGAQGEAAYKALNPQGLVPLLVTGEHALMQSLAIIEYLDETHPEPPLLPADAVGRAHVRAAAQIVAADIHPINNLRVLRYLKEPLGQTQATIDAWARNWISAGLAALESFAARFGGRFVYGDSMTLADLCLVPQLYNARRVTTDLSVFPRLLAAEAAILGEKRLAQAHPERQPDAG
jgi:maleylacetoacetate isomerase